MTAYGTIRADLVSLATVSFMDAPETTQVANIEAIVVADSFFQDLYVETGKMVEMLIGGSYLLYFRLLFEASDHMRVSEPEQVLSTYAARPRLVRFPAPVTPLP